MSVSGAVRGERWAVEFWGQNIFNTKYTQIGFNSPLQGGGSSAHVHWCLNRYRSYDPSSDTFLGYDGYRHRCNSPY